jgi:uncharacterized protein (DUF58 family)
LAAQAYIDLEDLLRTRYRAEGFSYLPRQPVHSVLTGVRASKLRGRGLNFEELRAYLPGDDIRNIDWKVTARTGKPHTRIYAEERDRAAVMIVDQRMNMFFGSRRRTKSAVAAEAAAASAWRVLSVGDRPGGLIFSDDRIDHVRPHRSETRVLEFLNRIVKANHSLKVDGGPPSRPEALNEVLRLAAATTTHDSLVVLISDLDGADDESARLMTKLSEHNDVLVVFVYDPLEARLPDAGRLVIGDGDLQLEFDSSETELRQAFHADFERRLAEARKLLLRRRIPVLTLSTDRLAIEQVRDQLGSTPQGRVVG